MSTNSSKSINPVSLQSKSFIIISRKAKGCRVTQISFVYLVSLEILWILVECIDTIAKSGGGGGSHTIR